MTETMHLARCGWQPEEIDMLWQEIRAAGESGAPLRGVFERMGKALGRKPNSVRNYYYMQMRAQGGDEVKRAAPFELFTEEDVHQLLRSVLSAKGKGQSVRACVMDLSGGDRTLMLRLQNKYRSILRKRPDMIRAVCRELEAEGLPVPSLLEAEKESRPQELAQASDMQDRDVQSALQAIERLAGRLNPPGVSDGDRLRVQRDLLLMQLEDLQLAARDVIACCKDYLGSTPEEKAALMPGFCEALAGHLAKLESCSG